MGTVAERKEREQELEEKGYKDIDAVKI